MKRKLELFAASLIVIIATSTITAAVHVYRQNQEIRHLEQTKSQVESDKVKTESELKDTREKSLEEKQQLEQKTQDQQKEIERLNGELQAKRERQESLAAASIRNATGTGRASAAVPAGQGVMSGCGDNEYAAYIYGMESGGRVPGRCNPSAVNPGGCRGIGQACPGSKLPCGADYACQNAYFTNYAMQRYGSWQAAYNFWLANHWW